MADIKTTAPSPAAEKTNPNGLGVMALAAIVVSSMIGGGIYSLPQNMAAGASAGAVLLAWIITGIGIYFIANTFSILSMAKPDLTTGIYMYSRPGVRPLCRFYDRLVLLAVPGLRKRRLCRDYHGRAELFLPALFCRRK